MADEPRDAPKAPEDIALTVAYVDEKDGTSTEPMPPPPRRPAVGDPPELDRVGRFRVSECIGAGGMGVVYAAHDDELDRDVAIKLLRSDLSRDMSGRERLMREAQAIAKVSHPNVVHVYEVGQEAGRVFMAMEMIRGQTLRKFCKDKRWPEIVDAFIAAGEGLAAAHELSIVHRDFKPDNVLVDEHGRARVVDFGLARSPGASGTGAMSTDRIEGPFVTPTSEHGRGLDLTGTGTVLGTPAYMAPEQLAKADPDTRTDQYAFCVSLFEMLYARRPFAGSTYTELVRAIIRGVAVEADAGPLGIPRAVRAVVLRGLSRDPDDRFESMKALLAALRKARTPRSYRAVGWALAAASVTAIAVRLATAPTDAAPTESTTAPDPPDAWAEIVAATDLPEPIATPVAGDPTGVTVHRLRNGLTVYVAQRPLEPKVAVTVALRAGSEQERDYGPGLGFLVLMSLYRGSDRLGVVDGALEAPFLVAQHAFMRALPGVTDPVARDAMLRAVSAAEHAAIELVLPGDLEGAARALGGSLSSRRAGSGTTLSVQLPAHHVESWLEILAEPMQRPAFRNLYAQVKEQLALYASTTSNDRALQVTQRELAHATGLREDYETATKYLLDVPLADAQAFHAEYYRPNNTAIVLVGDITSEQALAWCEQHFGAWEPAPIPTRPPVDRPLPEPVVRREIEDGGAPAVFVSWPLPPTHTAHHAAIVALEDALNRHDGLGSRLRDEVSDASWVVTPYRSLDARAFARPGQSLADAEAAVMRMLDTIATDKLPDEAWGPALARAELARLQWARTPEALARTIASSFIDRRSWRVVAAELTTSPTRPDLVAAAKALTSRTRVVVHKLPGATWHVPVPELPGERLPARSRLQSEFVKAIVDAPVAPPEPRFLVAGSHYDVHQRGSARTITADHEGPLAFASWVYPVGVDEDPFVCDAVRARMRAVRIPGIDFDSYCTNDLVWVDLVAPTARFDREAAFVFDWLEHGMPSESELRDHVERALQLRESRRTSATWRELAFHAWALRGEHGIDAHMPSDEALSRGGAKALLASLRRLSARASDVLYVGPSAARIRELVPSSSGRAAAPPVRAKTREPAKNVVYVLHDPARDGVEVRTSLPAPMLDARASLAQSIHEDAVFDGLTSGPPMLQPRWTNGAWWWGDHPLAIQAGYACRTEDVEIAVRSAIELLHHELLPDAFARAHRELEIVFRAVRTPAHRVPETVRLWGVDGTDPRVARWLALPSLEWEDMRSYYDAIAKRPVIVSIVGNADAIDLAALSGFGEVVRVEMDRMDEILRDPELSED